MMQPPYPEDKANLPVGLYIQRVYSDLKDGSQNLSTVVRNGTAKPIPSGKWTDSWVGGCHQCSTRHDRFTGVRGKISKGRWRKTNAYDCSTTTGVAHEGPY